MFCRVFHLIGKLCDEFLCIGRGRLFGFTLLILILYGNIENVAYLFLYGLRNDTVSLILIVLLFSAARRFVYGFSHGFRHGIGVHYYLTAGVSRGSAYGLYQRRFAS